MDQKLSCNDFLANKSKLISTNIDLVSYNKTKISVAGICKLDVLAFGCEFELESVVTKQTNVPSIIRLAQIEKMNLLIRSKESLQVNAIESFKLPERYEKVFEGLGDIKMPPVKFVLKSDIKPVICINRKIPLQYHDKVKEELQRMLELGNTIG